MKTSDIAVPVVALMAVSLCLGGCQKSQEAIADSGPSLDAASEEDASGETGTDGDADSDSDTDVDTDSDNDSDTDADTDADADSDAGSDAASGGAYAWHTFHGSDDTGHDIAVDAQGNLYIAGQSWAGWNGPSGENPLHPYSGDSDIVVLKLSRTGDYLWHAFYGTGDFEAGVGITLDNGGNIYVTGFSKQSWTGPDGQSPLHAHSGGYDIVVLKLSPTGDYQWHTFYGASGDDDLSSGIAVDQSGNTYITGSSYLTWNGPTGKTPLHPHSGGADLFALKLSSDGDYQWHTFYGSGPLISDSGQGIAVDGQGNAYITGQSWGSWNGPLDEAPLHTHSGSVDLFVLKLSTDGDYRWHTFYGSSSGDFGVGIATDLGGSLYVIGGSEASWIGPDGQNPLQAYQGDLLLLKLSTDGDYQWHTFYGSGEHNLAESSHDLGVDLQGNIHVTGTSSTSWTGPDGENPLNAHSGPLDGGVPNGDIFVLKIAGNGAYQWHTFHGSIDSDYGEGIALDSNGTVYITGNSYSNWLGPSGQSPLHAFSGSNDIAVLRLK